MFIFGTSCSSPYYLLSTNSPVEVLLFFSIWENMPCVLVKVSPAMKGQHVHGQSYKENHLIGIDLQAQTFSHGGRHGSS